MTKKSRRRARRPARKASGVVASKPRKGTYRKSVASKRRLTSLFDPVNHLVLFAAGLATIFGLVIVVHPFRSTPGQLETAIAKARNVGTAKIDVEAIARKNSAIVLDILGRGKVDFRARAGEISYVTGAKRIYVGPYVYQYGLSSTGFWCAFSSEFYGPETIVGPGADYQSNPTNYLVELQKLGKLSSVGHEVLFGIKTTHYSGYLDMLQLAAREAEPAEATFIELLAALNAGRLPVHVWVSDDGVLRRIGMSYAAPTAKQPASPGQLGVVGGTVQVDSTVDFSDFGLPVTITPPPPELIAAGGTHGCPKFGVDTTATVFGNVYPFSAKMLVLSAREARYGKISASHAITHLTRRRSGFRSGWYVLYKNRSSSKWPSAAVTILVFEDSAHARLAYKEACSDRSVCLERFFRGSLKFKLALYKGAGDVHAGQAFTTCGNLYMSFAATITGGSARQLGLRIGTLLTTYYGEAVALGVASCSGSGRSLPPAPVTVHIPVTTAGTHASALTSGAVYRPAEVKLIVAATPNQDVDAAWDMICQRGDRSFASKSGELAGRSPLVSKLAIPVARPATCVVGARGELSGSGRLVVDIESVTH